jgi:hypothetical protein
MINATSCAATEADRATPQIGRLLLLDVIDSQIYVSIAVRVTYRFAPNVPDVQNDEDRLANYISSLVGSYRYIDLANAL